MAAPPKRFMRPFTAMQSCLLLAMIQHAVFVLEIEYGEQRVDVLNVEDFFNDGREPSRLAVHDHVAEADEVAVEILVYHLVEDLVKERYLVLFFQGFEYPGNDGERGLLLHQEGGRHEVLRGDALVDEVARVRVDARQRDGRLVRPENDAAAHESMPKYVVFAPKELPQTVAPGMSEESAG